MGLIKNPVTGMKDILPYEMDLKQTLLASIRRVYSSFGYSEIETPVLEDIRNLSSKQGGDNEKLIFKVLKRGDKLKSAFEEGNVDGLCDCGLRYDLTLPLVRFYSNNSDKLTSPFKAMQLGNSFRAERPQKGRFRSFMQCDIDILGEATNLGEIDLLLATSSLLDEIGFKKYNYKFVINDRNILKALTKYAEFPDEAFLDICVSLDKFDKIGNAGVREELLSQGYQEKAIEKYENAISNLTGDIESIKKLGNLLKDFLDETIISGLIDIVNTVKSLKNVEIFFDPTLVRGMGYYTGTIFEIKADGFSGSIGGGGRYDEMVGKFTGVSTPAVGISLGFERLVGIIMEDKDLQAEKKNKCALCVAKDASVELKKQAFEKAVELRKSGKVVTVTTLNKNKKFQREKLSLEGFEEFIDYCEGK